MEDTVMFFHIPKRILREVNMSDMLLMKSSIKLVNFEYFYFPS